MIQPQEAVDAVDVVISEGTKYFQELQTRIGQPAARGLANVKRVIEAEQDAARQLPTNITRNLDLTAARQLYVSVGGWYPASLKAAADVTDAYLQGVGPSLLSGTVTLGGMAVPVKQLALLGGGVVGILLLRRFL